MAENNEAVAQRPPQKTWQAKLADRYYRSQCQRLGAQWSVSPRQTKKEAPVEENHFDVALRLMLDAHASYNGSNQ